jgi:hypothetical protein
VMAKTFFLNLPSNLPAIVVAIVTGEPLRGGWEHGGRGTNTTQRAAPE